MEPQNNYLAELSGVTKRFKNIKALDGLDLQVREGELSRAARPKWRGKNHGHLLVVGTPGS